ncbi:hypothetical protein DWB68_05335 [Galactobacter valiniphilus]|uniref:DNA/RNA non-specific endonuclease n=2 Tax=Galactobacter valiniphilus TaxID=2676122 RepID=A0A399JB09_9MICC|nr:hypothetical protein DWB68_05335 [Galactobacter valiniphilus]
MGDTVRLTPSALRTDADSIGGLRTRLETAASTLESALANTGGMIGSDPTAEEAGPILDDAADGAMACARNSSSSLGGLSMLTQGTARAYRQTELCGAFKPTGTCEIPEPVFVSTPSYSTPKITGADSPPFVEGIEDALKWLGIVIPNGDPGKLRTAASAWKSFGSDLRSIASGLPGATTTLAAVEFPSSAQAKSAVTSISTGLSTAATAADDVAKGLGDFATNIDNTREELLWMVGEFAIEIAVDVGLTIALSFIPGGTILGSAKAATTIAKWARKINDLIDKLKGLQRLAMLAVKGAAHGLKEAVKEAIVTGATVTVVNVARAGDKDYQQRNPFIAAAAAGVSGGVSSPIGNRVKPGGNAWAKAGAEAVEGAAGGLVDGGLTSLMTNQEFNPLQAATFGAFLAGPMNLAGGKAQALGNSMANKVAPNRGAPIAVSSGNEGDGGVHVEVGRGAGEGVNAAAPEAGATGTPAGAASPAANAAPSQGAPRNEAPAVSPAGDTGSTSADGGGHPIKTDNDAKDTSGAEATPSTTTDTTGTQVKTEQQAPEVSGADQSTPTVNDGPAVDVSQGDAPHAPDALPNDAPTTQTEAGTENANPATDVSESNPREQEPSKEPAAPTQEAPRQDQPTQQTPNQETPHQEVPNQEQPAHESTAEEPTPDAASPEHQDTAQRPDVEVETTTEQDADKVRERALVSAPAAVADATATPQADPVSVDVTADHSTAGSSEHTAPEAAKPPSDAGTPEGGQSEAGTVSQQDVQAAVQAETTPVRSEGGDGVPADGPADAAGTSDGDGVAVQEAAGAAAAAGAVGLGTKPATNLVAPGRGGSTPPTSGARGDGLRPEGPGRSDAPGSAEGDPKGPEVSRGEVDGSSDSSKPAESGAPADVDGGAGDGDGTPPKDGVPDGDGAPGKNHFLTGSGENLPRQFGRRPEVFDSVTVGPDSALNPSPGNAFGADPSGGKAQLAPNTKYTVADRPGTTYYTGADGTVSWVETSYSSDSTSPNPDLNAPLPKATYVVKPVNVLPAKVPGSDSYMNTEQVFRTDGQGRTVRGFTEDLRLTQDQVRNSSIQQRTGQVSDDEMNWGEKFHDGGHLFAASTGGGFEKINLVGMHHDQNRAKGQGAYTGEYFDKSWRGLEHDTGRRLGGRNAHERIVDPVTGESRVEREWVDPQRVGMDFEVVYGDQINAPKNLVLTRNIDGDEKDPVRFWNGAYGH